MSVIIEQGPLAIFVALAIGHSLADFPLQSTYLVKQKNRHLADGTPDWLVALSAHCLIHAGAVWLVTGSLLFAGIEFLLHALIDTGKSKQWYGLLSDQMLHLLCKLGFVLALVFWC